MKIKLANALNIKQILNSLANQKLPIKLSYKIMKFIVSLEAEEKFYIEKLNSIISQYSKKDENGNPLTEGDSVLIQEDKIEVCQKEVAELRELEIEISNEPFTLEELENLEFTPAELYTLNSIIE